MKTTEALKTKKAEEAFSALLIVVVLLILPIWGGTAMLVGYLHLVKVHSAPQRPRRDLQREC